MHPTDFLKLLHLLNFIQNQKNSPSYFRLAKINSEINKSVISCQQFFVLQEIYVAVP